MCIIALKLKGKALPKEEYLRNCEDTNKDGMGIAYLKDGTEEIRIKKDFKTNEDFIKWFYENIKAEDICMIHYRYATHGLKDFGNRHPFVVTNNKKLLREAESICKMAVAHNGVISDYQAHTKYSDTQKFIVDILAEDAIKSNIENPKIQKLISSFIGRDRLAIMMGNGSIYTWGEWIEHEGIYYSNSGYKSYIKTRSTLWDSVNNNKYAAYQDVCDGCGEKKTTKYISKAEAFLCKACRKAFNKGMKTPIETKNEIILLEKQCDSCLEWHMPDAMVDYNGTKMCLRCLDSVTSGGNN